MTDNLVSPNSPHVSRELKLIRAGSSTLIDNILSRRRKTRLPRITTSVSLFSSEFVLETCATVCTTELIGGSVAREVNTILVSPSTRNRRSVSG